MDNHKKRLFLGFVIALVVLTAVFAVCPKTALVITAYCFSLLAPTALLLGLLKISGGNKNQYITNAAFVVQIYKYAIWNVVICGFFVLLGLLIWSIPAGIFAVIQIILAAIYGWRILAMGSAQEVIQQVEQNVKVKTFNWQLIRADIERLKSNAPAANQAEISKVAEDIRYADPMSCPEVADLEEAIKANIVQLELKIQAQTTDEISAICMKLQKQVQERNMRLKMFK
jgi:hypothetical protein